MNSQFKKGVMEMVVLHILSKRECYGYKLVQLISDYLEITEGTIYPLLRRLNKEGQVETYQMASESGPSRKYYRLTPQGVAALAYQRVEWQSFVEQIDAILGGI